MKREIYSGEAIQLFVESVDLPNGITIDLDIVRHPGASAVVPFRDDGMVILIRQFRHAAGGYIYEIPAGKLSPGESPESCARREVEEEIGYRVAHLEKLTTILTAPGFCDEQIHLYLGTGLSPCTQRLDKDEVIEIVEYPFTDVMKKIEDQTIRDAKSLVALQMAFGRVKS